MFWLTFLEGLRVLSSRGFLYVNAPSSGTYHCYPLDHWRFYPDAGVPLELWGRRMLYPVRLIESFITDQKVHSFNDCVSSSPRILNLHRRLIYRTSGRHPCSMRARERYVRWKLMRVLC
jgi:hypothetical protein